MTKDELLKYNGQNGSPIYIAYKGIVYDVSKSRFWKTGKHINRHNSGEDITGSIKHAPHGEEVFSRFPVVDKLTDTLSKETISRLELFQHLYKKFHPHPISIHYPIALSFFAALMQTIFLITENQLFEFSAFMALLFYTLAAFPAIATGLFSWIINYGRSLTLIFKMKIFFSAIFLLSSLLICFLRTVKGLEIISFTEYAILYNVLLFSNSVFVFVIAYFGGKITWPG